MPSQIPGHKILLDDDMPREMRELHENVHYFAHDAIGGPWCDVDTHFTFWSGFINTLLWVSQYPQQAGKVLGMLNKTPGNWQYGYIDEMAGRLDRLPWVRKPITKDRLLANLQRMKAEYEEPRDGEVVAPVFDSNGAMEWKITRRLEEAEQWHLPDWPEQ